MSAVVGEVVLTGSRGPGFARDSDSVNCFFLTGCDDCDCCVTVGAADCARREFVSNCFDRGAYRVVRRVVVDPHPVHRVDVDCRAAVLVGDSDYVDCLRLPHACYSGSHSGKTGE